MTATTEIRLRMQLEETLTLAIQDAEQLRDGALVDDLFSAKARSVRRRAALEAVVENCHAAVISRG